MTFPLGMVYFQGRTGCLFLGVYTMYIMSGRDLEDSKRFLSETLVWRERRVAEENG